MKTTVEILGLFLLCALFATAHAHVDVSVSCMMAYEKGGAFAVFQSPQCQHWDQLLSNQNTNCQFSTLQGHRKYQGDRVTCDLDLRVPVFDGMKEAVVGVAAIFDGHGGKEASDMASKKLLDYFLLHVVFGTYKQALLPSSNKDDMVCLAKDGAQKNSSTLGSSHGGGLSESGDTEPLHGFLKEALLRAIHDIDMEFSLEAEENNYFSGSTATVVLLLDGKYLVASVGDSKALKCSYEDSSMTKLYSKELTRDHHPDRKDEKARIEAAGGFVRVWGVPRVNGILAVSRSIGDIGLKRYGVIAVPEVLDWQSLKDDDRYLVIASDGIFESLTPQDVCHLLQNSDIQETQVNSSLCASSSSLPDCIVNMAFREGSTDNLSAIVVPLK